jgi:hypothetical protein
MTADVYLFPLGRVLATPGVVAPLGDPGLDLHGALHPYLARHAAGDWGELDGDDQAANDWAVVFGDERLLSAYRLTDTTRIWVILVTVSYSGVADEGIEGLLLAAGGGVE